MSDTYTDPARWNPPIWTALRAGWRAWPAVDCTTVTEEFFVHFRRGEPASVRYRLEPMGSLWSPGEPGLLPGAGLDSAGPGRAGLRALPQPRPRRAGAANDPVVRACGLERVSKTLRLRCAAILLCLALYLVSAFLAMRAG